MKSKEYQYFGNLIAIINSFVGPRYRGRRLINITDHYKNAIVNFSSDLLNTNEPLLNLASTWQLSNGQRSIHQESRNYSNQLGLEIVLTHRCEIEAITKK